MDFSRKLTGPNPMQDQGELVIDREFSQKISKAEFLAMPKNHFGPRRTRGFDNKKDLSLILPGKESNSAQYIYLEAKSDYAAKRVLNSDFQNFDSVDMSYEFNHVGRQLVVKNTNETMTYDFLFKKRDQKVSGNVISTFENGNQRMKTISFGSWAKDQVRGPGFRAEQDVVGNYQDKSNDVKYFFFEDGIGGFEYDLEGDGLNENMLYSWSLDNGVIVGKRYRVESSPGFFEMADSKEMIESCVNGSAQCVVDQIRSYYLVQKNGRTFTFLRYLQGFQPGTGEEFYNHSDLQTFRKEWR